jgi:CHAT domain-containing protein/tetratricopeptide (TPR) repeat protein
MLNSGVRHLTEDELEALIGLRARSTYASTSTSAYSEGVVRHLADCQECRQRIETLSGERVWLTGLEISSGKDFCSKWRDQDEWAKLAAGIGDETRVGEMLEHAIDCDRCGPLLRQLMEDFSASNSPEESALLARLDSATPEWQEKLAARLSAGGLLRSTNKKDNARRMFIEVGSWRRAFALAVCSILVVSTIWFVFPKPQAQAQRLITEAYTQQRTLEMRISGAAYAPIRIERSQQFSHLDRPAALLEVEALIARELAKHPADPFWLQSRARTEILEGDYAGAIENLRQALTIDAESPSVLTDLATAYGQRAAALDRPNDFGAAIEILGKVLAKSPDDPVALFNRAVISEKVLLYAQAIEDWEHYLRLEPTGQWAEEARRHLQEDRDKVNRRNESNLPLLTPAEIASADLNNAVVLESVNERLESYVRLAITDWLTTAYPVDQRQTIESVSVRSALIALAKTSSLEHEDTWFADLLSGSSEDGFASAVASLSSAVKANERADTVAAQNGASRAIRLFSLGSGNQAGILRARLEYLFASNIAQDGTKCLKAASMIDKSTKKPSYRWLEVQVQIEEGSCFWLQENLGAAKTAYSVAAKKAADSNYKTIYLRAQDHASMVAGASGDYQAGWHLALEGLQEFWSGSYPDVRGYNFYYSLFEMARTRHQPFLQLAVWRDGLQLSESSADIAQRALAHALMASVALTTVEPSLALKEFARASQLFTLSPQIESTRAARLEAETRIAGVETSQGLGQEAVSRLKPIEWEVVQLSDRYLKILYFNNLGEALICNGEAVEAETALRSAVAIAELQLQSVGDEKSRTEWASQASDPYRNLAQLVLRRGNAEEALDIWESYKAAATRSDRQIQTIRDNAATIKQERLSGVASQLKDLSEVTIISYALLPQDIVVWVYDDRGIHWRHIAGSPEEIEAKVTRFRALCSNPNSDSAFLRREARDLYVLLIAPIETDLAANRTLLIELDARLNGFPIEALLDPGDHYFGEREVVVSSPGLFYHLGSRAQIAITKDKPALIVAVSTSPSMVGLSIQPLPDAVTEGEVVARRFQSAKLVTERQATVKSILSQMPSTTVFHFAGHTLSSSVQSGLLLSDSVLSASSLDNLRLPRLQLAVFSACDTQDGPVDGVNDTASLVSAFLRAGVPHIVASRWNVDSGASLQFMDLFYADLLEGNSVAHAIHHAQSGLRFRLATAHPFYWASFTAFSSMP